MVTIKYKLHENEVIPNRHRSIYLRSYPFLLGGGSSVCDGMSPIFSSLPSAYGEDLWSSPSPREKIVVPPLPPGKGLAPLRDRMHTS